MSEDRKQCHRTYVHSSHMHEGALCPGLKWYEAAWVPKRRGAR